MRTLPALPDDDEVKAEVTPQAERLPAVLNAREQLAEARTRLREAEQKHAPTSFHCQPVRQRVEGWQRQLSDTLIQARITILGGKMPHDAIGGWPWRGSGAPWVRRETLLQGLPAWKHSAILEALQRLEGERLVEGAAGVPARKSWAVRLTATGEAEVNGETPSAKLAELVALLQRRPDLVDVVDDALAESDGGEQ